MDDFVLVGNDIIGMLEYRVKCGRANMEGCVIADGKRYYVQRDGSFAFNEFPVISDKLDDLLAQVLDLKYQAYKTKTKYGS